MSVVLTRDDIGNYQGVACVTSGKQVKEAATSGGGAASFEPKGIGLVVEAVLKQRR